ncbi:protein of unknown function [Candidatus Methylacidiphilum fumarolicum]|uniref:Uncharacterized protein n=1 Tax=Candidatus Methylacidiphilum fumarolicum TaxID=591154 RepID=A0ABN8XDC4_9BACT|nr:protein of unknown function [Candidatus Methylacidiphilum fumarolicum]
MIFEKLPSLAASAPARALGLAGGEGRPIPAFLAVRCTVWGRLMGRPRT